MEEIDISKEWVAVFNTLTESQKRWFAAVKALEFGHGGISKVNRVTGLSRITIAKGIQEIEGKKRLSLSSENRTRVQGGGRKKVGDHHPKILTALEKILDETSAGDPMSLLKWTCKSSRIIANELNKQGFKVEYKTIQKMIKAQGYSLQANKKMLPGKNHPDRDSQFKHINRTVNRFIKNGNPVVSVDTKKKELVGNLQNCTKFDPLNCTKFDPPNCTKFDPLNCTKIDPLYFSERYSFYAMREGGVLMGKQGKRKGIKMINEVKKTHGAWIEFAANISNYASESEHSQKIYEGVCVSPLRATG